jgi:hypothetical protein
MEVDPLGKIPMADGTGPGAKASGARSRHGTYVYEVRGTDTDQRDRLHMHALFSVMRSRPPRATPIRSSAST